MTEFRFNSFVPGNQQDLVLSSLQNGGFVGVWTSVGQDGDEGGIYAQRFNALGIAQGPETQVNTTTTDEQKVAQVTTLTGGRVVVVWQSDGQDGSGAGVYARVFNANGTPVTGEIAVPQTTAGDQSLPQIAALSNGGFAVAWNSGSSAAYRLFNSSGQPTIAEIALPGVQQGVVDIASNGTSGATVMYTTWDATAQIATRHLVSISNTGAVQNTVDTDVTYFIHSSVDLLPAGQVLTTSYAIGPCGSPVSVALTDAAGTIGPGAALTPLGWPTEADIGVLSATRLVVAYSWIKGLPVSVQDPDAPYTEVFFRLFDIAGNSLTPVGPAVRANVFSQNGQWHPEVTVLANGNFIVGWESHQQDGSGTGLQGRMFDANGAAVSVGVAAAPQTGGAGNDTLTGNANRDKLAGAGGNDRLVGLDGADSLSGGAGKDRLFGGNDADLLRGEGGADTLNGGGGDDVLQGGLGSDRLVAGAGHDQLAGGIGNDTALGGAGHDVIRGQAGADSLAGGGGTDWIYGGGSNDILRGQAGADVLRGNAGADTIDGGGGADWIAGGMGKDILTGGAGVDSFVYRDVAESPPGVANCDVITDFTVGVDKIDLRGSGWSGAGGFATSGPLAANGATYQGVVLSIDVTGDALADLQIELAGAPALAMTDLLYLNAIVLC